MSHPIPEYDVFLSFRGHDTREKFTSHFCKELRGKNIKTFIDDDELDRGDEIKSSLVEAIKESLIYVVILSKHYASSRWCLDELIEILKCKEEYGRVVIPVFYEVDPSDVRHQRNSYADDLDKHHQRFGGKVGAWKAALTQVANLSGWDSGNFRPESKLVTKIVKDIVKKLNRSVTCVSSDYEGMTGIDNHIENIQSLLLLELPTVRIIGIWGMGGIGKTTIASAVFEKLAPQFKSKSIIRNVQQEIERVGLFRVKKEYLSQLLSEKITCSESNAYDQRLKRMKVLIVFDDVKDADQLKDLIGTHHKFGQGSRIIVTSRDKQVLKNANADEIYKVSEMDYQDSLQLFHSFAFKHNRPIEETYVSLSKEVLDYAQGLPLALQVLGSMLYDKPKEVWESQLQKLNKIPDLKIFELLKLSYDGLDDEQKNIFLDIACFFRGEWEKVVALILDSCGFSACKGMDDLKDRGLISISKGEVWMHDIIQEMGHEIVRLQDKDDPGKRSRLWKPSDIYDVLSNNKGKGTNKIQCIFLDMMEMSQMKVQLDAETFEEMHNLRMIKFYNQVRVEPPVTFYAFLKSFPKHLKFLCWHGFPQRSLPQDFCPKNLVILDMPHSKLEQLWEGDQALPKLKRLNLSDSKKLVRVPDLSLSPNIEEVILSDCESLIEVYSSAFLDNLNWLWLSDCSKLERLDIRSNILWRSSGLVNLDCCYKLETLLISGRTDVVQSYIYSDNCVYSDLKGYCFVWPEVAIWKNGEGDYEILEGEENTVVTSFNELCWLHIASCKSLTCLPAELFNFKFLRRLCLSGCSKLEVLPEFKETMENLKVLILDKTAIKELPSSLHHLVGLEKLILQGCTKLKTIPSSIGNLSKLLKLDLTYCESLETFPSSIFKLKLTELNFKGCSMLQTFPEILEPAESFTYINLTKTAIKELPSSLHHLVGLEKLILQGCTKLKTIPSSIGNLSKLLKLDLTYCESLETFPSSIFKLKLTELNFKGCSMLQTFPEILEPAESFTYINLTKTAIKELPSSLHHLVGLEKLSLQGCTKLKNIPSSIGNLSKLLELDLTYCQSLETFPSSIFKLKLTELNFEGCSMLQTFPEILEPAESFTYTNLTETAIKELPSSLLHLVGLQELSLQSCKKLKIIPSSIGNLSKLLKLNLAYCASLETFPNSIFKLKLTELNFEGCSMLGTFPEILESAESFAHINLTKTAIKELPSSLHLLVGLEILSLQSCRNLKTIPSSIGNLTKPFKLDLTYCESLETFPSSIFKLMVKRLDFEGCSMLRTFPEIPNDIGRLSSLTELSLQGSSIVNLPESLAHLSSLKSLNLSDCKLLECVPILPPNLNQVLAFDCPSIKRMVLNSCSDPGEGTFKFHLTNSQELDATSLSNIVEEACIKINDDAYWSVVFCFPGGAVPCWFHYCCKGHSVTMKKISPNLCSKNRLIGFALCAVLGPEDMDEALVYKFEFISDDELYTSYHVLPENYLNWNCPNRFLKQNHTLLWKHELNLEAIGNKIFHAQNFTFEFSSKVKVKECGIFPLFTKEIDTLKNRVRVKLQNTVV